MLAGRNQRQIFLRCSNPKNSPKLGQDCES